MSAAVSIAAAPANASRQQDGIPGCIAKREPDADFGWFSNRRLLIAKGDDAVSLSADDLRRLFDFVEANTIEQQI